MGGGSAVSDQLSLRCRAHKQTLAERAVENGRDVVRCPFCRRQRDAQAAINEAGEYAAAREANDALSGMAREFGRRNPKRSNDLLTLEFTYDDSDFRRMREPDFVFL